MGRDNRVFFLVRPRLRHVVIWSCMRGPIRDTDFGSTPLSDHNTKYGLQNRFHRVRVGTERGVRQVRKRLHATVTSTR